MGSAHYNPFGMPELPDLSVVSDALHASLAGRMIESAEAPGPLAVRGTPAELDAMIGQRVQSITRRGKFLLIKLDRDAVACNPMLTGRFQLAEPGIKLPAQTAFILRLGTRGQAPGDAAGWTRGASWVSAEDAHPEIRYRDPTQMGKIYLRPAGVNRAVPGLGGLDQGPDADDPDMTLDVWRERIRRHPGELKNLLRNQAFVAGIGNAYSDEILHAARLLPFRKRASLAAEEIDLLYEATRTTLANAIHILRARVPPTFERQVRDFLAVHGKGGGACARCETRITQVKAGGFVTSFCRTCQR